MVTASEALHLILCCKLPYPIPVALGIRYRTCSVFNNGYGTVPADTSFTVFLLSLSMCLDGKTLGYWERERKGKEKKKAKNEKYVYNIGPMRSMRCFV